MNFFELCWTVNLLGAGDQHGLLVGDVGLQVFVDAQFAEHVLAEETEHVVWHEVVKAHQALDCTLFALIHGSSLNEFLDTSRIN